MNSRLTHTRANGRAISGTDIGAPGRPNRWGSTTVNPAATTSSANASTSRRDPGDLVDDHDAWPAAAAVRRVGRRVRIGVAAEGPVVEGHALSVAILRPRRGACWVLSR